LRTGSWTFTYSCDTSTTATSNFSAAKRKPREPMPAEDKPFPESDILKGFVHYGPSAADAPGPEDLWKDVKRLRGAVCSGQDGRRVYEFLIDIRGRKRWAKSVDGGPLSAEGAERRFHRFYGVKAATEEELETLNAPGNFSLFLDGQAAAALKRLGYKGGFGEEVF
jgi:hypothetical protein